MSLTPFLRRAVLAAGLLALPGAARPAGAQAVSAADVAQIRSVITRQLGALQRDNAKAAFLLASPQLRAEFKTPQAYMRDARTAHAPLFRHSGASFRALWILDGEVVQQVALTDDTGALWSVYYPMRRQADGHWRIERPRLVASAVAI